MYSANQNLGYREVGGFGKIPKISLFKQEIDKICGICHAYKKCINKLPHESAPEMVLPYLHINILKTSAAARLACWCLAVPAVIESVLYLVAKYRCV